MAGADGAVGTGQARLVGDADEAVEEVRERPHCLGWQGFISGNKALYYNKP
jgi:hypothetical protein